MAEKNDPFYICICCIVIAFVLVLIIGVSCITSLLIFGEKNYVYGKKIVVASSRSIDTLCYYIAQLEVYDDKNILIPLENITFSEKDKDNDTEKNIIKDGKYTNYANVGCNNAQKTIQLSFKEKKKISRIVIYNRADCCKNLMSLTSVTVYDDIDKLVFTSNPIKYASYAYVFRPYGKNTEPEYYPPIDLDK